MKKRFNPDTSPMLNPSKEANFQPRLLGTPIIFENEGAGMITDENESEIYIESCFFTGWMSKAEFWELIGVDD